MRAQVVAVQFERVGSAVAGDRVTVSVQLLLLTG